MTMNKLERMSSVDTAWLRMDRRANLMMICGVMVFREPLAYERLRQVLAERFASFHRFRQRPVQQAALSLWEDDGEFDIDCHLHRVALPGKADTAELQRYASDLMGTPLDGLKPMWEYHLVENFEGGSALIVRIHHCYADGIALIHVMLSMCDTHPDAAPPEAEERPQAPSDPFSKLSKPIANAMQTALKFGQAAVEKGMEIWADPNRLAAYGLQGAGFAQEAMTLLTMGQDSTTRFKGKPGPIKRVAWAEPIALEEVKAVGKALGCSVNDVLLASVAGALRRYLEDKGDEVDGVMIRALVPVNLRPAEQAKNLGNYFGLVFLPLPVGIENPLARLYAVRQAMLDLKGSQQPVLALALLAASGMAPKLVQDQLLDTLSKNASAVMTNVPGPQQPMYLAGAKIDSMMFWVPQSGNIGMGVSILSYNNHVHFGLVTDRKLVPDPEKIIAHFQPEFSQLLYATLLAPWDGELQPDDLDRLAEA
ncbi:MAG: wax ester/triacylglycerol synthase family O-acyltransferase [Burkholderiales bacterium]|nr:MAG: wax ester/triacylglycerol synthase family O-acyltransferase [Burkholderiales bacterium]